MPVHLFRGAPCVRSWSKHQATVEGWTLCGIPRKNPARPVQATEEVSGVSCPYCLDLMGAAAQRSAQAARIGENL